MSEVFLLQPLVTGLVALGAVTAGYFITDELVGGDPQPAPTGSGLVIRALGDSVTAGYGYADEDSEPFSYAEALYCGLRPAARRCQDPDGVAYPARFAASLEDANFKSYARSGSTPAEWLGEVRANETEKNLSGALDAVVGADPDITAVTIGANPLLRSFLTDAFGRRSCVTTKQAERARICFRDALEEEALEPRLLRIYERLLATPADGRRGLVVVVQYPESVPPSAHGVNVAVLTEELRAAIARSVETAIGGDPERRARLLLADPGPFLDHGCDAQEPWILKTDTCIHPNAAGHMQLAAVLAELVRKHGADGAPPADPGPFASPGTSCGVFVDRGGRWPEATELRFGVTGGRRGCESLRALFDAYLEREGTCTIANGVSGCALDFEGWTCQRAPGYWLHPANFACDSSSDADEVPEVVGLYAAETTPSLAEYSCGEGGEGGGPFDVRANFDCEAAIKVASELDHKFGFLCRTEVTGRESSRTLCRLDGARVEWTNGA